MFKSVVRILYGESLHTLQVLEKKIPAKRRSIKEQHDTGQVEVCSEHASGSHCHRFSHGFNTNAVCCALQTKECALKCESRTRTHRKEGCQEPLLELKIYLSSG
nr:auxin response factor 9 [Tanacetum cinerariifolium]